MHYNTHHTGLIQTHLSHSRQIYIFVPCVSKSHCAFMQCWSNVKNEFPTGKIHVNSSSSCIKKKKQIQFWQLVDVLHKNTVNENKFVKSNHRMVEKLQVRYSCVFIITPYTGNAASSMFCRHSEH